MAISLAGIKPGMQIKYRDEPYEVQKSSFAKQGRGVGVAKTKLRNLKTGAVIAASFQGNDKLEEISLDSKEAQYLYSDDSASYFMDKTSYEQFEIPRAVLEDKLPYMKEGLDAEVLFFEEQPLTVNLPIKIELKVQDAPPGVKGDTATGGSKMVTLETGLTVSTPLFIKAGDMLRIDTRDGSYVERAN